MNELINHREILEKIADLSYLVLDPRSSISELTTETLMELGVDKSNIYTATNCSESIRILRKKKTSVLICFLEEDEREVFKVIDSQKILMPRALERIFLAFSHNRSMVSFAHALEGDVDDFMVEPFTKEKLVTKIKKSVKGKLFPTPYKAISEEIEIALKKGENGIASKLCEKAKKMHPRPTNAYLSSAKVLEAEGKIGEAITEVIKGLKFNKSHYKSLLKLHDLYFKSEDYSRAQKVLRRLSELFPLSQSRTLDVFRQAILKEEFEGLKRYCRIIFENQPFVPLLRIGTAGLIICALKQFMANQDQKAINLLKEVHKNSSNDSFILKNLFKAFDRQGLNSEAESIFKSFKVSDRETEDFQTCAYLRELNTTKSIDLLVSEAPKRLAQIHFDQDAFAKLYQKVSKEASSTVLTSFEDFSLSYNMRMEH